jgi:hypothetical protein
MAVQAEGKPSVLFAFFSSKWIHSKLPVAKGTQAFVVTYVKLCSPYIAAPGCGGLWLGTSALLAVK